MGTAASFMGQPGFVADDPRPMPKTQDGANYDYDTHAWNQNGPTKYTDSGNPWERGAIRAATVVMTMPRRQIQKMVRPPLPQIGPRVPRRQPAPDIHDIFATARLYPDNRTFYSGSPADFSGSPRNSDGFF